MLVGDYEFDLKRSPDVKMLPEAVRRRGRGPRPVRHQRQRQVVQHGQVHGAGQPPRPGQDLPERRLRPWQSFRESEDSRYVAMTLPRVLARLPYGEKFNPIAEFNFEENVDGTDHDKYQWMSSAWAYAARITDAFAKYGWMARTRGVEGGGKVEGLPVHTFPTDDGDVAMKCPTEIAITDRREFELSNLGFLPLIHCKGKDFAAFMGAQSCQKPKKYDREGATANADLSTKLNHILCVSRFAHFLKVMARNQDRLVHGAGRHGDAG